MSDKPHAHLVRVDLNALSVNLMKLYGREFDELTAAQWLTQSVMLKDTHRKVIETPEPSPFKQSDEWGIFYVEEEPIDLLYAEEILEVVKVERSQMRCKEVVKLRKI